MKISYVTKRPVRTRNIFATIGVFDGVHLGHQKVIDALIKSSKKMRKKAACITFSPHPFRVLHPEKAPPMLISLQHRLEILSHTGVDVIFVLPFTRTLAGLSARDFIEKMIVDKLNIGRLFVGENFNLGRGREGNVRILKKLAAEYGISINVIKGKTVNKKRISSTLIRKYVIEGKLKEAQRMLGRRFSVLGNVIHGRKRGRILGFPTANLDLHHEAVPPSGAYAVFVRFDGRLLEGILNIGFRPTFMETNRERTVEVHIFGLKKQIYGKDIEVIFIERLREERHFTHKDHLRAQINKDMINARRILKRSGQAYRLK